MHWPALLLVIAAASACGDRVGSPTSTSAARRETTPPAGRPAISPAVRAGEIRPAAETTSTGRRVVEIGRARLRALPTCCTELVLRTATNRVLAVDGAEVKQWDVTDGRLVARDTLSPLMAPRLDLVVSTDGSWVASGDSQLGLVRDGTRVATVRPGIARAFTSTNTLVIESKGLALIDPNTGAITHRLPKQPFGVGALTIDVAGDEDRVWWLSKKGYARWDRSSGVFSPITPASMEWRVGRIALRAPFAMVEQDGMLYRLDLSTGTLAKITTRSVLLDLSPSGRWAVLVDLKALRVIDATTGAEIARLATAFPVERVAFSEQDETLAFVSDGVIHIADIDPGNHSISVRVPDVTSRFVGWTSDDDALVEHEGRTQRLDMATLTLTLESGAGRTHVASASPLALTVTDRTVTATRDAKQVAKLDVGDPPRPGKGLEQSNWRAVASPTGETFSVLVRRPDVPPESEPDGSVHADRGPRCFPDPRAPHTCLMEYVLELWSVDGPAKLLWRVRPDSTREPRGRTWPYPKEATGSIAFTPDGKRVLFGFADGDVIVRSTDASATNRTESLHRGPITRIEVSPGGTWVFTEDAEGEQRIWPL